MCFLVRHALAHGGVEGLDAGADEIRGDAQRPGGTHGGQQALDLDRGLPLVREAHVREIGEHRLFPPRGQDQKMIAQQHRAPATVAMGFEPDSVTGIVKEMARQTRQAVAEADVVVLVVDLRTGGVTIARADEAPTSLDDALR